MDDAVIARIEKGGSRYEILVDPDLVDEWKNDPSSVSMDDLLAIGEVWTDSKSGERPTSDALENVFGSSDLETCVTKILREGSIQLTTIQRKKMVEEKRLQIISEIASTATDTKTKMPHPRTRIENAIDEATFSVDHFRVIVACILVLDNQSIRFVLLEWHVY